MTVLSKYSPQASITDNQWQEMFEEMRSSIEDCGMHKMKVVYTSCGRDDFYGIRQDYHGETSWETYCKFINDILRNIRSGNNDYCFFKYQIADLLRFEHDRLCSQWIPGDKCFKVWLKKRIELKGA